MLSPLIGIIASSGVAASTTAYESIATVNVGAGGTSSISFTSIPSTYQHLQVRAISRSNYVDTFDYIYISTPSAGTWYHGLVGDGSTASAIGGSYRKLTDLTPGSTTTASVFSGAIIDILDYANTNKNKTVRSLAGYDANGSGRIVLYSSLIDSTNAISTLTFTSDNASNFAQYTSFALYGIKGA